MLLVRICAGGGEQSLSLPRRKSVGSRAGVSRLPPVPVDYSRYIQGSNKRHKRGSRRYTAVGTLMAVVTKTARTSGISNGSRDSRLEAASTLGKTAVQTTNVTRCRGAALAWLSAGSSNNSSSSRVPFSFILSFTEPEAARE